ncbi:hypothetical protein BXZ70DRAFT_958387 [Cristinia sonorae]|uniref:mRNA-decapping enzyme 1B n=1 Tax=Cristinia sonorae TaxID=1940300 RepID=A0A8K0UG27_9AGAR|nr:hypothetical protein BXZ70DRAFT_958387 [Cristinia sonorae]
MARGRQRATSNAGGQNGHHHHHHHHHHPPQPFRPPTSSPQLKRQHEVASNSIYQNNLTVLRRRDPSIESIIDQFSHVCLYQFNGSRWLKEGFEGSMFLVEHHNEPKYGYFILNRMNSGDYNRRIYPEDELDSAGGYLMYRYFSEYTEKRLSMDLPYPLPSEHRPLFDSLFTTDSEDDVREAKGIPIILGFWMFGADEREPLKDVMLRLHSYVKQGLPYPEEYRHVPGRRIESGHSRKSSEVSVDSTDDNTPRVSTESRPVANHHHTSSEVDMLFARLQAPPSQHLVASQSVQDGSSPSANILLQALSGKTSLQSSVSVPATSPNPPRGLALLDTIFASALNTSTETPSHPLPSQPEEIEIVSPKPTSSALPQILNQDVIYSLLGLASDGSSRTSSVAPSTPSSHKSRNNRYEGDNEYSDSLHSDTGYSTSSTIDFEDPAIITSGPSSSNIPVLSFPPNGSTRVDQDTHRRIAGDATPRVINREMGNRSPLPNYDSHSHSLLPPNGISAKPLARTMTSETSVSTVTAKAASPSAESSQPRQRALIPFQADSDLWPYPRAPVDERDPEDSDVVELDFSDTRALSDPAVFSKKQQKQKQNGKRKSRRERAVDREREREEIEKGWDDPNHGQAQTVDMVSQPGAPSVAKSPAPPPLPVNGKHTTDNGTNNGAEAMNVSLSPDEARHVLLSALGVHSKAPNPKLPRKQFVQEILGLIYSDPAFVDRLYQDYSSRIN